MQPAAALNLLNFFLADVRDGLGPFLAVFLLGQGWTPSQIGIVMTVGGLLGMLATTPMGALVDSSRHKRMLISGAAAGIVLSCFATLFFPNFGVVAASQSFAAIVGALIGPAVAGLTLGLVGREGFAHQLGRNEAFNHGGNAFAALLAGAFGWWFGIEAVFFLMAGMGLMTILAVRQIDPARIDHARARGLDPSFGKDAPSGFGALVQSRELIIVALVMALFHFGNAAMLPLLGQRLVATGEGDPSAWMAACIIVAQFTMIPVALLAAKWASARGYRMIFLVALIALPLRGVLAWFAAEPWMLVPVQILDGVGAGLLGVALPGLVERILEGSGRYNLGLGAVMTVQGVGAALSTTAGGFVAQYFGYDMAFLTLAGVAFVAVLVFVLALPSMQSLKAGDAAPAMPGIVPGTTG